MYSSPKLPDGLVIPDHHLERRIGEGGYGEIWLARNVIGTYRAVKIVFRSRFDSPKPYEREFTGLKSFEPVSRNHPGFVDILRQVVKVQPQGIQGQTLRLHLIANPRPAIDVADLLVSTIQVDAARLATHQPARRHPAGLYRKCRPLCA